MIPSAIDIKGLLFISTSKGMLVLFGGSAAISFYGEYRAITIRRHV